MNTLSIALQMVIHTSLLAGPQADPWQREYTREESTQPHVMALWQFNSGHELEDSSGHGHSLQLFGAATVPVGKFGGGLQSFPGWPVEDKRHAAVAKAHPDLSPKGPFTIDLWLKPAGDLPEKGNCHLLCKKYVSHHDYQLLLTPAVGKTRRLMLSLGYGYDSETYFSDSGEWPADVWQHIAVTYDGEGTVRFHRNGETFGGRTVPGRRGISAGPLPLSIADRTGSNYAGFPGVIDQVRISQGVREFGRLRMELSLDRRVYVRFESRPVAIATITNLRPEALTKIRFNARLGSVILHEINDLQLAAGEVKPIEFPLETSLRPDEYDLSLNIAITPMSPPADSAIDKPYQVSQSHRIRLVGRSNPDRMPVLQWGVGGDKNIVKELPRLKEIGFTHCLGLDVDSHRIWQEKKPQSALKPEKHRDVNEALDEALANDLRVMISLSPGHILAGMTKEFARQDRNGKADPRGEVNGLYEPVQAYCEDVGFSAASLYHRYPAFEGALIHSETRDGANPSFSAADRAAYQKATGLEIPSQVTAKWGIDRKLVKSIQPDGVIPDDDAILHYYQWYWREGDGWPRLNSATVNGFRRGAPNRTDLWTFHDPAVRVASTYGSGGNVDVLSQWTYSYPEPIRIGLPTDELFAMARGAATPQRVMKMTQIIWYRSQTAPIAKGNDQKIPSPWDDHDPDAAYITISPMQLREAFWTKISRPIQGIMYHGWESLVPADHPSGYRYTHSETQRELKRLIHEIVEPYGPMLRNTPAAKHDVAFYESFAAQMFARRGAYGWSHTWTGDCYQVLQHAGLQADVVYDETINTTGLDQYKILVIPDGDVLTKSVADRILAFQKRGGIVVGDDRLASVITPEVKLTPVTRTKKGDIDKAAILKQSNVLRSELAGKYTWPCESANPEVIPYRRSFAANGRESTCVFCVNDYRDFGNYVGQHGLVQEVGRRSETKLTLRGQQPGSVVYDVVRGQRVEGVHEQREGTSATLTWQASLGPCDGAIFLVTPRPVAAVDVNLSTAKLGESCTCGITIRDDRGTAVPAVLPIQVILRDPDGRPAERSGYSAAANGTRTITFDFAKNDLPGAWELVVRSLASDHEVSREVIVHAN